MSSEVIRWETTSRPSEVEIGSWAGLFDLADHLETPWQADELASVLAHQMGAPLHFELLGLASGTRRLLRAACETGGAEASLRTFGDLFRHPEPPLVLLVLVKKFAKAHRLHPSGVIPPQVAAVLYYACIAVASVRWNRRISSLTDDQLARGLRTVLAYDWIPDDLRPILRLTRIRLENGPPGLERSPAARL